MRKLHVKTYEIERNDGHVTVRLYETFASDGMLVAKWTPVSGLEFFNPDPGTTPLTRILQDARDHSLLIAKACAEEWIAPTDAVQTGIVTPNLKPRSWNGSES